MWEIMALTGLLALWVLAGLAAKRYLVRLSGESGFLVRRWLVEVVCLGYREVEEVEEEARRIFHRAVVTRMNLVQLAVVAELEPAVDWAEILVELEARLSGYTLTLRQILFLP